MLLSESLVLTTSRQNVFAFVATWGNWKALFLIKPYRILLELYDTATGGGERF